MKDGSYEYMAVVHADSLKVAEYVEEPPYEVIRCDADAHIVFDRESGTKAFAFVPLFYIRHSKFCAVHRRKPSLRLYSAAAQSSGRYSASIPQKPNLLTSNS